MPEHILDNNFHQKTRHFIKKNLRNFFVLSIILILAVFSYIFYKDLKKKNEIQVSEQYTQASIYFKEKKTDIAKELLENIINKNHKFYSPLALYFIIDNKLETDPLKIIILFDKILSISSIDQENLNLIKIKKTIFLFSFEDEQLIIKTLNPIINSDSVWRNMAIKLISDYFLSKDQKKKADKYIQLLSN